ncbi:ibr domain-containing protein [Diplodia corticola]|uniref:Ibr domain-containing protein n=1 Tax=Diplodia corticola TaxID=236234 RepID=A0A1J9S8R8_9PEZI|nr:ibr domain-containing protein [Diplodia corticola]OJD35981.1 ibr domain-containing protein [Diplodia corticola]
MLYYPQQPDQRALHPERLYTAPFEAHHQHLLQPQPPRHLIDLPAQYIGRNNHNNHRHNHRHNHRNDMCDICFDTHARDALISPPGCLHKWCHRCLDRVIKNACQPGTSAFPPRCCGVEVFGGDARVRGAISLLTLAAYNRRQEEEETPPRERTYCHRRECRQHIRASAVKTVGEGEDEQRCGTCEACGGKTCMWCRDEDHPGRACPGRRRDEGGRQAVLMAAERNGWKTCWKCGVLVEKTGGCTFVM